MNQPLLSIENLKVAYGPTEVLHGVTLDVKPGEIVTLIGSNGAGKTTLLKSLFGAPRAREGRNVFRGEDTTTVPTHPVAPRGPSLLRESPPIFPSMSVVGNPSR